MKDNKYPASAQFFSAYFHPDVMLDHGGPDEVIAAFMADEPREFVWATCNDLERVLKIVDQMDDPNQFLWQVLGCHNQPNVDGVAVSEWLKHVHRKLCG